MLAIFYSLKLHLETFGLLGMFSQAETPLTVKKDKWFTEPLKGRMNIWFLFKLSKIKIGKAQLPAINDDVNPRIGSCLTSRNVVVWIQTYTLLPCHACWLPVNRVVPLSMLQTIYYYKYYLTLLWSLVTGKVFSVGVGGADYVPRKHCPVWLCTTLAWP